MLHLGPSRPTSLALALPGWLGALVSAHGAGVFAGAIRIAPPGTPEHAALHARSEAERARRDGSLDWVTLRSGRGARSFVIGEGIGAGASGLLFCDPSPRPQASALWLACADGRVCEAGDDADALHRAIARGAPSVATPPRWLAEALAADADALDVPRLYDTRDDDDERALRDALMADDEAAADAAFERFAGARTLARRLVETRAAVAGIDTPAARALARQIDRTTARSPAAAQLGELRAREPVRTIHALEAIGLAPGGVLDERLASELDGRPNDPWPPVDASRLAAALERLGQLGDAGALVTEQFGATTALDASAWIAVMRDRRVGGGAPRLEPVPIEWLAPVETCWPVLALALFEGETCRGASSHLVTVLSRARHPGLRSVLLAMLEHAPLNFVNGAAELAADRCLAQAPATAAEASRWIAAARRTRALPKRYVEHDADAATPMALLVRSVALPEVARFFVTDVTRSPYAALEAAKAATASDAREILHALYTGAVPLSDRLTACELAVAHGDGRARAHLPALQKAMAAEGRRLSRM